MTWFNSYKNNINILMYSILYVSVFGFSIIFMLFALNRLTLNAYLFYSLLYLLSMMTAYAIISKSLKRHIIGRNIIIQKIVYPLEINLDDVRLKCLFKHPKSVLKIGQLPLPKWAFYFKNKNEISLYESLNNLKYPLQLRIVRYSRSGLALVKNPTNDAHHLVDLRNASYLV